MKLIQVLAATLCVGFASPCHAITLDLPYLYGVYTFQTTGQAGTVFAQWEVLNPVLTYNVQGNAMEAEGWITWTDTADPVLDDGFRWFAETDYFVGGQVRDGIPRLSFDSFSILSTFTSLRIVMIPGQNVGVTADQHLILSYSDGLLIAPSNAIIVTPLPAALPLFATGLGVMGLLGWRRKRKAEAMAAV
jgi:hypothetical protein